MKIFLLGLTIILNTLVLFTKGQTTQQYEYTYDANGNRVIRKVILLQNKKLNANDSLNHNGSSDSTNKGSDVTYNEHIGTMEVRISPNPTHAILNIKLLKKEENSDVKIELYNTASHLLYSTFTSNNEYSLDVSKYPKGTYILKCSYQDHFVSFKILKQ